jgi:hypothetical protein
MQLHHFGTQPGWMPVNLILQNFQRVKAGSKEFEQLNQRVEN